MMRPSCYHELRLAALFKRDPATYWSKKEVKALSELVKEKKFDNPEDLDLLERYYAYERKKGEKGCHRRDLCTFLNNFQPELDRARLWAEQNPSLARAKKAPAKREEPEHWKEFLAEVYPKADQTTSFWDAPTSAREAFKEWEKNQ